MDNNLVVLKRARNPISINNKGDILSAKGSMRERHLSNVELCGDNTWHSYAATFTFTLTFINSFMFTSF